MGRVNEFHVLFAYTLGFMGGILLGALALRGIEEWSRTEAVTLQLQVDLAMQRIEASKGRHEDAYQAWTDETQRLYGDMRRYAAQRSGWNEVERMDARAADE